MGLKDFNADLRAARSSTAAVVARRDVGIFDLKRGDSDGELSFQYTHTTLLCPLSIQVLAQNTSSYPRNNSYMLFIMSDMEKDTETQVLPMLKSLAASLKDKPIDAVLPIIAEKFNARLDGEDNLIYLDDDNDDEDTLWSEDSESYDLQLDPLEKIASNGTEHFQLNGSLTMQKRDLGAALIAGVSVGSYELFDAYYGMVSLSIPVSRWGMSPETLEAWDLTESDHVVLLIRLCGGGHSSAEDFLECRDPKALYHFALGKCSTPKPSDHSAYGAFRKRTPGDKTPPWKVSVSSKEDDINENETASEENADFEPLYLFSSIERILQRDLAPLINIRLGDESLSWSEALTYFVIGQETGKSEAGCKLSVGSRGPRILRQHAMGSVDTMSIPLVAMNCAVYLMVHSGQHCVICGRPLGAGFETMRPYVCDRDLCLDQYHSLNLGPGIEHEIISNPHVVDLLVSFFYNALLYEKVLQFPKALRLKCPGRIPMADQPDIRVNVCAEGNLGTATMKEYLIDSQKNWLEVGAKVMLVAATSNELAQQYVPPFLAQPQGGSWGTAPYKQLPKRVGYWYHNLHRYLCTIVEVSGNSFTFTASAFWNQQDTKRSAAQGFSNIHFAPPSEMADTEKLPDQMIVLPYSHDVCDLSGVERDAALLTILCGLPSILSLRTSLLENPGQRLGNSSRFLDPATYRLLLWIVASNRSFIVQDEPVVDASQEATHPPCAPNRVLGMQPGWLQFRFVQGSPEKEHRFAQEMDKVTNKPRTLFGWHGSQLQNWHSIVSTGLNFNAVTNGRSSGNGVYFSEQYDYSARFAIAAVGVWPNSDLGVSQAISMCEIINRKDEFVATTPHLVVNKLDWIQCRFLFVRVNPKTAATYHQVAFPQGRKHLESTTDTGYLDDISIRGSGQTQIRIPKSAIPSRLKDEKATRGKKTSSRVPRKKRGSAIPDADTTADDYTGVDIDGILTEEEANPPEYTFQSPSKRRKAETDFEPGTLDWDSIPRLPDPKYPSSGAQKILMREFKAISKAQEETDLIERGWHIDFSKLENMFHWIVELHSFDEDLPLAKDMKKKGCKSIVLEINFGSTYPMAPPFARVIRPRFLEFAHGGGGNVTAGGSICSEMLVTQGWMPTMGIEKVIMQIRLQLCDLEHPARLKLEGPNANSNYSVSEALDSYKRAAAVHGWSVTSDLDAMAAGWTKGT